MGTYVLITPAHNEAAYIERTIESVLRQTLRPQQWVIVDDRSDDGTAEIIRRYANEHDFITAVSTNGSKARSFAAKVAAFEMGRRQLRDLKYDFIGNLDADLSFDERYYESILNRFRAHPRLGIAGGVRLCQVKGKWQRELSNPWSVCAGIQLFRRKCYEEIGGYPPLEHAEDAVVELLARMRGWQVRAFEDLLIFHYRPGGGASAGVLVDRFRHGQAEYRIGYHPLFMLGRLFYRINERPYLIGSLVRYGGYLWAFLTRRSRLVTEEVASYLRKEQMQRLVCFFKKKYPV